MFIQSTILSRQDGEVKLQTVDAVRIAGRTGTERQAKIAELNAQADDD